MEQHEGMWMETFNIVSNIDIIKDRQRVSKQCSAFSVMHPKV